MDDLIGKVMYWTFYGIFFIIGKILRFTFDVLVYLVTLGYHRYKPGGKGNPRDLTFPLEARFEHTHIVAGTGHGKTQLLQMLILDDIMALKEGKGSLMVIDSQADLLKNILNLAVMADIKDRIILIDPYDVDHPPALNLFDFGLDRITQYSAVEREQLLNSAVSMYEYLFGALLGAELTARQGMIFRYLARLLMVVPGATIHTFREFIQNPETTIPYYNRLDPNTRLFFETEFSQRKYDETRQQIVTRLWIVLSNNILARMFTSEKNSINFFEAMNRGSLVLVYTAKAILKQEGCELLGRFCLALIAQATQERANIPEDKRRATFVYIDEAHDYFDESLEQMLTQARKNRVGLVISHQSLSQLDMKLREILMGNTSIKLVGGVSADDTQRFAREFKCAPELFAEAKKTDSLTTFICSIKNQPPASILSVPLLRMEKEPKISDKDYNEIVENNRKLYCTRRVEEPIKVADKSPLPEPEMI
jgi:hypothetical protein